MIKKIMCLSLIAILAISSIGACSAAGSLTSYYWTLKGAQDYCNWYGYDNYDWYGNQGYHGNIFHYNIST